MEGPRIEKRKANYLIDVDLWIATANQANEERRRPAHVVEDALRDYLSRKGGGPRRRKVKTVPA